MYRARIRTPYAGSGVEGDPFRPAVADAFPLQGWQDLTGHPAEAISAAPGPYEIGAILDEETLNAIKGDGAYELLESELIPDEVGP